jgi:light-regulated signal transduction histidine kinase (bacteriophytochrome)
MKQIILDLLEYSRSTRPDENTIEVDFNELVSDFKQLRRNLMEEKQATLTFKNLPTLVTYRAVVTQIIHCLLDNALKYTKKGIPVEVKISAVENKKEWKFSVKDNGIGIEPQFYSKIFAIFQRLHNKEEYAGTGIGLSIAKRHVEFLGGEIWLKSELGKGTVFYFTVPKIN